MNPSIKQALIMTLETHNESTATHSADSAHSKNGTANLSDAIQAARDKLLEQQHDDGHWVYELEADCTIPAEYILMNHFVGEVDDETEQKIAQYLRDKQTEEGGWSLYTGGDFDISCSVKAYYALKIVGDDPHEEHMVRAKNLILNTLQHKSQNGWE